MRLTPLDIKKHEFSRAFRGYDLEEVQAFLEMVADEMLTLQNSAEELKNKNIHLETQLADFRELEEKWKATMINAQESAERALENSRREADIIRREAEVKAEEIQELARKSVAHYKEEIESLRQEKRALVTRLQHLLKSELELIEVLEKEEIERPES
jgi:cell division initiation protein